jgi:hypothetical protein
VRTMRCVLYIIQPLPLLRWLVWGGERHCAGARTTPAAMPPPTPRGKLTTTTHTRACSTKLFSYYIRKAGLVGGQKPRKQKNQKRGISRWLTRRPPHA